MKRLFVVLIFAFLQHRLCFAQPTQIGALSELSKVKVGVPTVLSGDLAVLGDNIAKTVETYRRHYLRHPIEFIMEDARKNSLDGLKAYQRLINFEQVDMLIGGTTSNGTLAAKELINSSKTVLITPLTGGANIDSAGPYIFRIGNSDILNGFQQADLFTAQNITRVAILTEETEYTQDISKFFLRRFAELGGQIVFEENFVPETTDFRPLITKLRCKNPQALLVSTQTGLAFGIFLKQLKELGAMQNLAVHTNFVAALNPDAYSAAGEAIYGVHYLAPRYDQTNPKLRQFFELYEKDHGHKPNIAFHTAGTVDALDMLQAYLDQHESFEGQSFQGYLLSHIKGYQGLMGQYSFDDQGNADIGFIPAQIAR